MSMIFEVQGAWLFVDRAHDPDKDYRFAPGTGG
jgi:hypothetical protein